MAVEVLRLDLSKSATRKSIFGQLVPLLDEKERGVVGSVVGDVSIRTTTHFHNLAEVEYGIGRSVASSTAKENARAIYRILAEAEAVVHGCPVEETHFHEVGAGMTAREILGICTSMELLAPKEVESTVVQPGSGTVECSHGMLNIPAPATAAIIEKYHIPLSEDLLDGELCTPTSAAIIAHYVTKFV